MAVYGFHASHEQMHPAALLDAVRHAERVGFAAAMCSDHVEPWSERQGHSGFAWSWLGAALEATRLPYGVVNAPGQRYHPVIVAQAVATLAAMYPGRFWVALGSGQAMNEHVTGDPWPRKDIRMARLRECVEVIRALHAGEEVSHDGLVTVDRARVWSRPEVSPPLYAAAVSASTAAWAAAWADGLVTVNQPLEVLRRVVGAYRNAGGRGPAVLQVHLSYARDEETALRVAHEQWRTNLLGPELSWELATAAQFDAAGAHLPPAEVRGAVLVSSDPAQHAAWLGELAQVGFDEIYLHHVGQEQTEMLDVFGERVLPQLGAGHR